MPLIKLLLVSRKLFLIGCVCFMPIKTHSIEWPHKLKRALMYSKLNEFNELADAWWISWPFWDILKWENLFMNQSFFFLPLFPDPFSTVESSWMKMENESFVLTSAILLWYCCKILIRDRDNPEMCRLDNSWAVIYFQLGGSRHPQPKSKQLGTRSFMNTATRHKHKTTMKIRAPIQTWILSQSNFQIFLRKFKNREL